MRILTLSYFYEYNYGGAEIIARLLRDSLEQRGFVNDVLCLGGGPHPQPGRVWRMPIRQSLLRFPQSLKRSIIFLNNRWFDRAAYRACRKLGVSATDYDLFHCEDTYSLGLAHLLARQDQVPIGLTLFENYPRHLLDDLAPRVFMPFIRYFVRRRDLELRPLIQSCAWVSPVSDYIGNRARKFLEPNCPLLARIYSANASSPLRSIPSRELHTPPRLLFIGRVSKEKGADVLFEAAHRYDGPFELTILGLAGPLGAFATRMAARDNRFRIRPPVPPTEVAAFYDQSDVVCCPSVWPDPLPSTVIEARIHGRAVLTTDRGGIPEILDGYPKAVLLQVEGKSREQLIESLRGGIPRALERVPLEVDLRKELSFLEKFSPQHFVSQYAALYRDRALA